MAETQLSTATSLWIDLAVIVMCWVVVMVIEARRLRYGHRSIPEQTLLLMMLIGYLAVYVFLTFLYRKPLPERQTLIKPFWSYAHAFSFEGGLHIEHLSTARQILLNILVYVPPGCILPALLYRLRHPYWVSAGLCALLSLVTEGLQWLTCLGYCETDDLINNTLGGLIGILIFHLGTVLVKRWMERKSRV